MILQFRPDNNSIIIDIFTVGITSTWNSVIANNTVNNQLEFLGVSTLDIHYLRNEWFSLDKLTTNQYRYGMKKHSAYFLCQETHIKWIIKQ